MRVALRRQLVPLTFLTLYFVSGRGIWSELGYKVIILAKRQRKFVNYINRKISRNKSRSNSPEKLPEINFNMSKPEKTNLLMISALVEYNEEIKRNTANFLLDCGAEINLIDLQFLTKVGISNKMIRRDEKVNLKTPSKTHENVTEGSIILSLYFQSGIELSLLYFCGCSFRKLFCS